MHIKRLNIQGFKTYLQKTTIDDFSPHHNCILGLNGSGKSNIFEAIQFVLSDKYSSLRAEDRHRLLYRHEASAKESQVASVEIIFDNSDRRFQIVEKDEVSLKRQIGLKKDEYFVDGKHYSKSDVVNLLESAGMSRSNPYYIVQQHRVNALMRMNEAERLELLKDIAGTRTYDDRRKESLRIMADTDAQLKQINNVVEYIEKRLSDLESEKNELAQYQELDSRRRALEYAIYSKEEEEAKEKLADVEAKKESMSTENEYKKAQDAEAARIETEEALNKLETEIHRKRGQKKQMQKELRDLVQNARALELTVTDAQDRLSQEKSSKEKMEAELKKLRSEIPKLEKEQKIARKTHETKKEAYETAFERLKFCESRTTDLYSKQNRASQFKSKAQRDTFLKKEIGEIEKALEKEQAQEESIREEIKDATANLKELKKREESERASLEKAQEGIEKFTTKIKDVLAKRDEEMENRKALWQKKHKIKGELQGKEDLLRKSEKELQSSMEKSIWRGLQDVQRIVEEQKLQGYHGPLIELFTCPEAFERAVEVTAGNSLFHVVVKDDALAALLIEKLTARNSGRLTFMPLNQLNPKKKDRVSGSDVIPMMDKLNYDQKYEKAIREVFGRTVVCRDLAVAAATARANNIDAITLGGDQAGRKGAMTGGFVDGKRSRLKIQRTLIQARDEFKKLSQEAEQTETDVENSSQQVTVLIGELEKAKAEKAHQRSQCGEIHAQIQATGKLIKQTQAKIATLEDKLRQMEANQKLQKEKVEKLKEELQTPMAQDLSNADQEELEALNAEATQLKDSLLQLKREFLKAESSLVEIQNRLESTLMPRQSELEQVLVTATQEQSAEQFEGDRHALEQMQEQIRTVKGDLKKIDSELDKEQFNLEKLQVTLEKHKATEAQLMRNYETSSTKIEKLHSDRALLLDKIDKANQQIRELGSLPKMAFSKFQKMSVKNLMKELEKCSRDLEKFSQVNKKALDQFLNFSKQREDLIQRKEDLDRGRESINSLIESLDMKKDEAVIRTFKGIAQHFRQVFSQLVAGGQAKLVMKSKSLKGDKDEKEEEEEVEEEEEEEEEESKSGGKRKGKKKSPKGKKKQNTGAPEAKAISASSFTGVGISVSFTGGLEQKMQQLSGGQQAVLALSLIFAIQRCDPSPFYLFDEVDAALDPNYREAVANMIHDQCKTTQFITTTFRPEIMAVANQLYGVVNQHNVSKVKHLDQAEARELLSDVEAEEAKRRQQR